MSETRPFADAIEADVTEADVAEADVTEAQVTEADVALIVHDLQLRLRSRFPGLESVLAFDGAGELAVTRRMLVLWLMHGDDARATPPEPPKLTGEERAACVVDALFAESAECSICLQTRKPRAAQLRCGHSFCRACIAEWLERARTCPICRTDVVRD